MYRIILELKSASPITLLLYQFCYYLLDNYGLGHSCSQTTLVMQLVYLDKHLL